MEKILSFMGVDSPDQLAAYWHEVGESEFCIVRKADIRKKECSIHYWRCHNGRYPSTIIDGAPRIQACERWWSGKEVIPGVGYYECLEFAKRLDSASIYAQSSDVEFITSMQ